MLRKTEDNTSTFLDASAIVTLFILGPISSCFTQSLDMT